MAQTHSLKHNGAAYNDAAALINPDTKVTAGEGRALCTCGLLSEQLSSGSARRAWHKQHRITELDREVATEKAETELIMGQDVLADTPADEVQEALAEVEVDDLIGELKVAAKKASKAAPAKKAPAAKPAKKAPAKKAPKAKEVTAADEPNAHVERIAFTTAVADSMWRFLGRDGVITLVDTAFPTVTARPDNNSHIIVFSGPVEDVPAAVDHVVRYWAEAIEAVKAWKETDEAWINRPKGGLEGRKASYFMTGEFYTNYAGEYAHRLAS